LITNGAQLIASTESSGDAGNIILHVDNRLLVEGYNSAILAGTLIRQATGDGGSVFIRTPESFEIRNGAQVAVSSEGTGTAGDLFVWANALVLSNQGALTAETVSNTGGNITLQLASILAMEQNSRISTTAGTANAGGDGGNIVIRSPFVVAAPDENSDITANAFTGQGGRVEITTEGLFGLIPRSREELETLLGTSDPTQLDPANLPTNDITAISQTNPTLNGEVVIRTPGLDPSQGTIVLPSGLVDVSRLLARGCAAQGAIARNQGSLVITGRGGLPPSPTEGLPGEALLVDWDTLDTESAQSPAPDAIATTASPIEASTTPRQIVEVQTLVRQADGQVILAAQPNHSPPSSDLHSQPETCPAFGTDQ
jgi:large exoprotein involved in heme utilization and adhesion